MAKDKSFFKEITFNGKAEVLTKENFKNLGRTTQVLAAVAASLGIPVQVVPPDPDKGRDYSFIANLEEITNKIEKVLEAVK